MLWVGAPVALSFAFVAGAGFALLGYTVQFNEKCPSLSLPLSTPEEKKALETGSFKQLSQQGRATQPAPLERPLLPYPKTASIAHAQGVVVLQELILKDGSVSDAKVVRSSGFCPLDNAAIQQVKGWRYKPGTFDGKPLEIWKRVNVIFQLPGREPLTLQPRGAE